MSKKCVGEIACACGHTNTVTYTKPNYFTETVAKWECKNCWTKIQTIFKRLPGEAKHVKQDSFVIEPSDKLNRILQKKHEEKKGVFKP